MLKKLIERLRDENCGPYTAPEVVDHATELVAEIHEMASKGESFEDQVGMLAVALIYYMQSAMNHDGG